MSEVFDQDIKYLPGVGPRRRDILAKDLNITTWGQLLEYFPYKYIDRSRVYSIRELTGDMPFVQIMGRIVSFEEFATGVRQKRIVAHFTDGTGMVDIVWFRGGQYIYQQYKINEEYVVFGRPTVFNGRYQFAHPDIDKASDLNLSQMGLQPYYSTTERMKKNGMNSHAVEKTIRTLLTRIPRPLQETLPPFITGPLHLMSRDTAMRAIHYPRNTEEMQRARQRLKFEELFYVQLNIVRYVSDRRRHYRGYVLRRAGDLLHTFFHDRLPFPLTEAQKRVMHEIHDDMRSGEQMNRLLQGDVGSGKTLVAAAAIWFAAQNGWQSAMLAPTEILARQHAATLADRLEPFGVNVTLLVGGMKAKEKKVALEAIADGRAGLVVGTHAVLTDSVEFKNLGLAIVDEQHRFGVRQRGLLAGKAQSPHLLVMSATPIPRTLGLLMYGDLDISVLDELPPGRKPIKTWFITGKKRRDMYGFIEKQLAAGHQAYVVCPAIEENEMAADMQAVKKYYTETVCPLLPNRRIGLLHGKMKPKEKDEVMLKFKAGELDVLVSTTVIEVGVDVPNATVMVIENAERFGLSALHQLRGRVGRGAADSCCILISDNENDAVKERLRFLCHTSDGFAVAKYDLENRGPGDFFGSAQHGLPTLRVADLVQDTRTLKVAQEEAKALLAVDPNLAMPQHRALSDEVDRLFATAGAMN